MYFHSLHATFGHLEKRQLSFSPGFNIIESPNETGKSTLAAFLRVMLYGLPTRERGALADKNRYLPWSGSPMQGKLALVMDDGAEITLQRDTARANSPMGRFTATYTGTSDTVDALNGADCGEQLLGVPLEVYERSAFIRQNGLAFGPDAELERRIAALITGGDEDVSYSEAAAALKRQLNQRRANSRSGVIPALEREIDAAERSLDELRELQNALRDAEDELSSLKAQEETLRAELAAHDLADRQLQFAQRERARHDAESAEREARLFRGTLADAHTPPRETLEIGKSRLQAVADLSRQRKDAERRRDRSDEALRSFDAAPDAAPRPVAALWLVCLLFCAALPPAAILLSLPVPVSVLYASAVGVVLFAALTVLEWMHARERKRARAQKRGVLEAELRDAEAGCAALRTAEENAAEAVFADIPAGDLPSATAYIHENLARYDMLSRLEADAAAKRQVYASCPKPDLKDVPARAIDRPARTRDEAQEALAQTEQRRADAQSRLDRAAGRLHALTDSAEPEAALAEYRARLRTATEEYDAIALAMETLDHANAAMQSRFSPELGKRAAEYFAALTDGKYDAVALDRSFHALASESGDAVGRDAALLSQGAGNQLYLAVRLAICDMVLPQEPVIPLVLDDALISFDDVRCRTALTLLERIAQTRQILLLTCQHREAAYLAGHENVHFLCL